MCAYGIDIEPVVSVRYRTLSSHTQLTWLDGSKGKRSQRILCSAPLPLQVGDLFKPPSVITDACLASALPSPDTPKWNSNLFKYVQFPTFDIEPWQTPSTCVGFGVLYRTITSTFDIEPVWILRACRVSHSISNMLYVFDIELIPLPTQMFGSIPHRNTSPQGVGCPPGLTTGQHTQTEPGIVPGSGASRIGTIRLRHRKGALAPPQGGGGGG